MHVRALDSGRPSGGPAGLLRRAPLMASVSFETVRKVFGKTTALRDVDLAIRDGEAGAHAARTRPRGAQPVAPLL